MAVRGKRGKGGSLPNGCLSTKVPDLELDVLVCYCFYVESDGRDGGDDFTDLKAVEDGGFAGRVESEHEYSYFFILVPEREFGEH